MKLLLDTHIFFWWIALDTHLIRSHRDLIEDRDNDVYVSAVTGWEVAIKVKLGKWPEAAALVPGLAIKVENEGFRILDLTMAHAEHAGSLPLVHRDPFDRFLAAQSLMLDMPIVTVDRAFELFNCKIFGTGDAG